MHPRRHLSTALLLVFALGSAAADPAPAPTAPPAQPADQASSQAPTEPYYIPTSMSPEAYAIIEKMLPVVLKAQAARPVARTADDFRARQKQLLAGAEA